MADGKSREETKPGLYPPADVFEPLRDAVSSAARNLGLAADVQQISAEHWQRVLAAVEARAVMRGHVLPPGWRDELAVQMGRSETYAGPES